MSNNSRAGADYKHTPGDLRSGCAPSIFAPHGKESKDNEQQILGIGVVIQFDSRHRNVRHIPALVTDCGTVSAFMESHPIQHEGENRCNGPSGEGKCLFPFYPFLNSHILTALGQLHVLASLYIERSPHYSAHEMVSRRYGARNKATSLRFSRLSERISREALGCGEPCRHSNYRSPACHFQVNTSEEARAYLCRY